MADDQVLADLQRLMDAAPEPAADTAGGDPLEELEALKKEHEKRVSAVVEDYRARRAALEAKATGRNTQNDQQARAAEIERIKAGLQAAA